MNKDPKDRDLLGEQDDLLSNDIEFESYELSDEDILRNEIFQIDVRIQEIDALIERYEDAYMINEEEIYSKEELLELKIEYKELRKTKKELKKRKPKTKWDTLPVWLVIYSLVQIIMSFYFILIKMSLWFTGVIVKLVDGIFNSVGEWAFYFGYFFIPFILLLASLIILLKLKDKFHKKVFAIIYIIHGLEIIITIILMIIALGL